MQEPSASAAGAAPHSSSTPDAARLHARRGAPPPSWTVRPPRAFRLVEVGSVIVCVALDVVLAVEVAGGFAFSSPGVVAAAWAVLAAYLAADLVSGLVHFVGDSFGTVDTPWLGRTFVLPFRSHHDRPQEICAHDFVETNGNNAFAALFALVPAVTYLPAREGGAAALLGLFVLVFTVTVLLTNQIHKWAHVRRPPRLVRALQRAGVLLSPERHRPHHLRPHGRGYCVTSGLFNAVLDPIGFFPALERGIRAALRLEPREPYDDARDA